MHTYIVVLKVKYNRGEKPSKELKETDLNSAVCFGYYTGTRKRKVPPLKRKCCFPEQEIADTFLKIES